MQALTDPTLFPCYAPEDAETVREAVGFLEKGADVRVFLEEGELRPGEDLASKAGQAQQAAVALIFFSHHSLPRPWRRAQWEGPLVHEPAAEKLRIGFVRCDDCAPPRVLTPQFDIAGRRIDGFRQMKRWLRRSAEAYTTLTPETELLALAIADRPGIETVNSAAAAEEFVRSCAADFDAAVRVNCAGRTLTAAAGEIGSQLGLSLEGDLPSNLQRLEEFCRDRRFLVVLEGVTEETAEELAFSGRCSILLVREAGGAPVDVLAEAQRAFTSGPVREWPEMCRLARQGRQAATARGRLAECYELMKQWEAAAREIGDSDAMKEAVRRRFWILQDWGQEETAARLEFERGSEYVEQLPLF